MRERSEYFQLNVIIDRAFQHKSMIVSHFEYSYPSSDHSRISGQAVTLSDVLLTIPGHIFFAPGKDAFDKDEHASAVRTIGAEGYIGFSLLRGWDPVGLFQDQMVDLICAEGTA
jgi:hypothetical protein